MIRRPFIHRHASCRRSTRWRSWSRRSRASRRSGWSQRCRGAGPAPRPSRTWMGARRSGRQGARRWTDGRRGWRRWTGGLPSARRTCAGSSPSARGPGRSWRHCTRRAPSPRGAHRCRYMGSDATVLKINGSELTPNGMWESGAKSHNTGNSPGPCIQQCQQCCMTLIDQQISRSLALAFTNLPTASLSPRRADCAPAQWR